MAVAIAVLGICFGKVVENSLEEIGEWVVMGIFIVGTFEVFAYILAPFFYHRFMTRRNEGNREYRVSENNIHLDSSFLVC